jgi:hypothetical protein
MLTASSLSPPGFWKGLGSSAASASAAATAAAAARPPPPPSENDDVSLPLASLAESPAAAAPLDRADWSAPAPLPASGPSSSAPLPSLPSSISCSLFLKSALFWMKELLFRR